MKFEELQEEWEKDRPKRGDDLAEASFRMGYLHGKYHKFLRDEKKLLNQLEVNYKNLLTIKHDYYMGKLSEEELAERGWTQFQLRITKSDIERYFDADPDLIKAKLQLQNQKDKVFYLVDLLKNQINYGNTHIKNAIEYLKFINGKS